MPRAARICATPGCPVAVPAGQEAGHCPAHRSAREIARGSASARHYGADHQRRRARALRALWRAPLAERRCALCGDLMVASDALDLDHSVRLVDDPSAKGDRIVHRRCNQSRERRITAPGQ